MICCIFFIQRRTVKGEKGFIIFTARKNTLQDVSAANLTLYAQNQVYSRRMLYLSLLIDSVRHCIRYVHIRVFYEPHFPVYKQNPITYTENYVSEKTHIFLYFTQCDVFHWLAQKITHHWTGITDIILKISNCKDCYDFVNPFFHILTIFNKKATTYKNMSLRFSVNSLEYTHFWTLVLKTILILINFFFNDI